MRIAELSRRAGVPVPTVKFYLREGLLPPGELSSPNQARYDERHLRRLRLVRALLDVGRMPIAAIRALLADLDRPDPDVHHALGSALQPSAANRQPLLPDTDATEAARREADDLIIRHGWQVGEHAPARQAAAEVIAAMRHLGVDDLIDKIDEYADAAETIAATDLELIRHRGDPEAMVYGAVVGTILGDALLAALRRLAQENASAKMFHQSPG